MKKIIALALVFGSAALSVHAAKYDAFEDYEREKTPHHFNLQHEMFLDKTTSHDYSMTGKGRGWRGNYEYIAPDRPYFSLEGAYSSIDDMDWKGGPQDWKEEIPSKIAELIDNEESEEVSPLSVIKQSGDINMKLGATCAFDRAWFIPYAAIGYHAVYSGEPLSSIEDIKRAVKERHSALRISGANGTCYAGLGAKCKYAVTPWFDVGLNGQINHGLRYDGIGFASEHHKKLLSQVGYRASLPVSFHLGNTVQYHLEAEPYLDRFKVGSKEVVKGARLSAGIGF